MKLDLDLELVDRIVKQAENDTDAVRGYVVATGRMGLPFEQIQFIKNAFLDYQVKKGLGGINAVD